MDITIRFKNGISRTYSAAPLSWWELKGYVIFDNQIINVSDIQQLVVSVGSSEWGQLSPPLYSRIQKSKARWE